MPESEPKPKLIELVAPGAGQGWKAVLKSGKAVVVHEIPVPPAEAAAAIPRLQRLADHKHPALSPVLAWGTDPNGIWVAVEPNEGTPLATMLSRGPLTPPAAAALGAAVLSGVAALHEAGIAMGGFGASAIRVTGNGDVRLAGHPAAAVRGAPGQSDLRADVRSCGMAVCAAFGVDPAGAPAPPNIPPGLVVTMRSMASGAMGPAADRAQNALREMAAALLAPDRQVAAQSELALRAGGRETPGVTPFLPKDQQAAAAAAPVPIPIPIPIPVPPPAPAPFVPQLRDETPVRAPVSYDAPARATETYPGIPAPTFAPPTPPAPVPAPAPEIPAPRPIPTWSEAPVAPAAVTPPAPVAPNVTRSPFDTVVPTPATGTNPPATAPPAPPAPVPTPQPFAAPVPVPPAPAPAPPKDLAAPPVQETWTPVETPAWKPPETTVPPPVTEWTGTPAPVPAAPTASAPPRAATPAPIPVAPPPAFPRAPAPTPARQPTVARSRPPSGGPSNRPSWLIPAIIAVVLILLLGTGGAIILANRGKTSTGPTASASPSAKTSPKATVSPSATATPTATPTAGSGPRAVPSFGPAAADPVTKVMFCTTATPCSLGSGIPPETATACDLSSCTVEVAIYFSAPQKAPVQYSLKFFNRCTGVTTDLPGPNAYTPPGYVVVIPTDKWRVNIPSGTKSGALVAVSQQPAVAASAPLLLGSDTSCA
jgi:hypothetical protein